MPGSGETWCLQAELAEVDAVDRRLITILLGRSRLLCLHSLAARSVAGVDGVLAIMTALRGQSLALCSGQILAHFSAGQGRLESGVRRDEFGLLGKGGTG